MVALVGSPSALLAPPGPAAADVPTFYKIGYGDLANTYLVNPDGTNNTLVANANSADFDWTPDGEKFVYRINQSPGHFRLRNQNGAEFPVGTIGGQDPKLSPDGTRIAYTRYDQDLETHVVDVVDLSGNFLATLGPGRQPAWSPDGTKIAYAKRGERTVGCGAPETAQPNSITFGSDGLAVAQATGGSSSWLIEPAAPAGGGVYWQVGSKPDWSPDGTTIVLHGEETRVFYSPDHGHFGGCVSEGFGGNDFDVYTVASGGGNPTNLTDGAAWSQGTYANEPADLNASFSPDGEHIAFASGRNTPTHGGIHSLWMMSAGGGAPTLVKTANRVDRTDWMTALPVGEVVRINALDPCATEEGPTPGTFTIERTGVTDGDVDVTIEVDPSSTATSGSDFPPIPTTVTIPDGTSLANLVVFPTDDDVPEPDETIVVAIVSADGGLLVGEPSKATITIADNDGGPPGPCTPEPPDTTPPTPTGPSDVCLAATASVEKSTKQLKKQKKQLKKAKQKDQSDKVKKLKKKVKKTKTKVKEAKKAASAACA